jgi:hypothetical protein
VPQIPEAGTQDHHEKGQRRVTAFLQHLSLTEEQRRQRLTRSKPVATPLAVDRPTTLSGRTPF